MMWATPVRSPPGSGERVLRVDERDRAVGVVPVRRGVVVGRGEVDADRAPFGRDSRDEVERVRRMLPVRFVWRVAPTTGGVAFEAGM